MYVFMYTKCVPGAYSIQERESGPLEFELGMVVSQYVGIQNHIWVL